LLNKGLIGMHDRYTPPPTNDFKNDSNKLESTNYENTVLFLVSCFQYVLVAAVFSIGPPYRKPIYTNVWLMLSIVSLSAVNIVALLAPPAPVSRWLNVMQLPFSGRMTLCVAVVVNMIASVVFEDWAVPAIAKLTGGWQKWYGQRRVREGKAYKMVEGGMGSGL